jgi:hypothetical protein
MLVELLWEPPLDAGRGMDKLDAGARYPVAVGLKALTGGTLDHVFKRRDWL